MIDIWKLFEKGDHQVVVEESNKLLSSIQAADVLHVSGLSLVYAGNISVGVGRLKAALSLINVIPHWYSNAAICLLQANAVNEAMEFATLGIQQFPDDFLMHYTYGNALMTDNKSEAAVNAFNEALRLQPDFEDAILNKGNCLRRLNRLDEALACYTYILSKNPDDNRAKLNSTSVYMDQMDHEKAEPILRELASQNEFPESGFMLGMLLLGKGEYAEGWKLYHGRWKCSMALPDLAQFSKPMPKNLAEIKNKHVVIIQEQGFGDSLQFVRFLPEISKHAGKVSVLVPQPLLRLFRASFPDYVISDRREDIGDYDFEIPFLDMPYLLGTTLETIPSAPYLNVPDEITELRAGKKTDGKKRIGLIWAGQCRPNPDLASVDGRRSLHLDTLAPLLDLPNVEWVNLQMGDPCLQALTGPWKDQMEMPLRSEFDFLDTAGVMRGLDLVITADTAPLHLAGGIGEVPVWMMSRYDQCWRWLRNRTDSPYYPTLRIFQQPSPGDWNSVVQDIKTALLG